MVGGETAVGVIAGACEAALVTAGVLITEETAADRTGATVSVAAGTIDIALAAIVGMIIWVGVEGGTAALGGTITAWPPSNTIG